MMRGQAVVAGPVQREQECRVQAGACGLQRPDELDVELHHCIPWPYARFASSAGSGPALCSLLLGVPLQDNESTYL